MDIKQQASQMYQTGRYQDLLDLAHASWPKELDVPLPNGISDVAFFARNAARRLDDRVAQEVWHARALSSAVLTGAVDTGARLVLSSFFALMDRGSCEGARESLKEMLRLIDETHEARPFFMRLYHEKTGYSYLVEQRFPDALEHYSLAIAFCAEDSRGALKAQGAATLASYLALRDEPSDVIRAKTPAMLETMNSVRAMAEDAGFVDVVEAASCNISLLEAKEFEGWEPFELT